MTFLFVSRLENQEQNILGRDSFIKRESAQYA